MGSVLGKRGGKQAGVESPQSEQDGAAADSTTCTPSAPALLPDGVIPPPDPPAAPLQTLEQVAEDTKFEPAAQPFTFYDIFFWRDAPDWYYRTFAAAGFGLGYCTIKQYLNRHELEVFMPPRAKVLPERMQQGYRESQMLKYGFLRVGREVTTIAGAAAAYYAGAYYLGEYRGHQHTWHNFAASGALAGLGVSAWLIRPWKLRPTVLGVLLGSALGAASGYTVDYFEQPHWDLTHDFEGWWLGSYINLKKDKQKKEAEAAAAAGGNAQQQKGQVQARAG